MTGSSDYRAPSAAANEDRKVGWLRETVQAGEQWQKQQRAYPSIQDALDLILTAPDEHLPAEMSNVRVPRAKRQIRELVAIMANMRPTASNKTDNVAFYEQAQIFNLIDRWWWYQTFADMAFRGGFQTTAVTGTGYISHVWDPDFHRIGRGDIRTDVYSATDVYLINPPRDFDLQKCYAVVMKRRVPIHLVWAAYPLRQHEIAPDHGSKAWTEKGLQYVQSFLSSPLKNLGGYTGDDATRDGVFPTCDIYETYVMDRSVNTSDQPIKMGQEGTSWAYEVPAYGQLIPTGTNGYEGLPNYRKATIDDALIYPYRRRIIGTENLILEDDTSPWWHGHVPLARFRFDDWPWEALGFPLTRDVLTIENDSNELARGISDAARVRLAPPMAYDENTVSDRLAERLNPRQPRQMLKLNMQFGDAIKAILPANYADLPNYIPDWVKYLNEQQDFVIGVRDLLAVAKAKQIPSADAMEKLLEMAGPLAQDMTRNMERGMRDLGEMRRFLNMQFRTYKMRLEIGGDQGAAAEDYEIWDPGNLIPSHMADEADDRPSRYSYVERARRHAQQFYYHVVPNSMSRMQSMQAKLLLLQLEKTGFPLDPWTKSELYEIDNFGPAPEGANTILERWVAWQRMQAELQQAMGGGQPQPQRGRGRPSTNARSPQLRNKDGGTRSTVATSR